MSNYKMVIVMRRFPKIGNGKYIAQACHAALGATDLSSKEDIRQWSLGGNAKIILCVKDVESIYDLQERCKANNLVSYLVVDAGRTEFAGPTVTALAIGPHDSKLIDPITSKLPLF